jgi:transcriptional antiterminator RfaH
MACLISELSSFSSSFLADVSPLSSDAPPESLVQSDRRWSFLYTKARQEKALARDLAAMQIQHYLPLVGKDNVIRGRKVRSQIPLFSGYVFLYSNDVERVRALTTNRVAHSVEIDDQPRIRKELLQIYRLIEADAPLTVERRLVSGQKVRIKSGPFKDIEGTLVSVRDVRKLLVSIHYLGQGVTLEIGGYQLEPA